VDAISTIALTQYKSNPLIANYVDALYFTITCLTTTGVGDITLRGTSGRLLSVIIMLAASLCSCGSQAALLALWRGEIEGGDLAERLKRVA
jgi:hypothetical protein